jgi:regulatory protein
MGKITEIKPNVKNKLKVSVFIDDEFAFSATAESVKKMRINVGDDVTESGIKKVMLDSDAGLAFNQGVNRVCRSPLTKRQMGEYLQKKGYDEAVVEIAMRKMEEYRYIDDAEYAKSYVGFNAAKKGGRRLKRELKERGVADEIVSTVGESLPDQHVAATRMAEKFMKTRENDKDNLSKLYRHLAGKGFDFDVINDIVRSFGTEEINYTD